MPKIKVHEKALAHLSRGLYRSPASAIRELVSNAWDADATIVRVNTNYPHFHQVSVQDNGIGFSSEEFKSLMAGGIGNSQKRPTDLRLKKGRPVIGRLGIGMLGIAQICGRFSVTSRTASGEVFKAEVHLYDLLKKKLDKDSPEVVVKENGNGHAEVKHVDIGKFDFVDVDPASVKPGTLIVAYDVSPTFAKTFQDSVENAAHPSPGMDWKKNFRVLKKVRSLQELGDYWRLVWELGACAPVPYFADNALPDRLIVEDNQRLEAYNFKVFIDGIPLIRPVFLKGNEGGYTTHKIEPVELRPYQKPLKFHGYIAVQEGSSLKPDELRGLMIRINNVGIGSYDPSMLDYRFNEGPRSRWLTGEVYVDEGLEDALNVDRDSFNKFHPEYRELQSYLHEILQTKVFPEVYKQIDERSRTKHESKKEQRRKGLKEAIEEISDLKVTIRQGTVDDTRPEITEDEGRLQIRLPKPERIATKKSQRELAAAVILMYELSGREKSKEKQRDRFNDLLLKLLSRW